MLENKNEEAGGGGYTVIFIKFLRLSCNCCVERTQKQRIPKQAARGAMEVTRTREKPQKRQRDEVELDLK